MQFLSWFIIASRPSVQSTDRYHKCDRGLTAKFSHYCNNWKIVFLTHWFAVLSTWKNVIRVKQQRTHQTVPFHASCRKFGHSFSFSTLSLSIFTQIVVPLKDHRWRSYCNCAKLSRVYACYVRYKSRHPLQRSSQHFDERTKGIARESIDCHERS